MPLDRDLFLHCIGILDLNELRQLSVIANWPGFLLEATLDSATSWLTEHAESFVADLTSSCLADLCRQARTAVEAANWTAFNTAGDEASATWWNRRSDFRGSCLASGAEVQVMRPD